ncbi:KPN_02809 family neutral zinc metallopeptidase [Diaphorobacter aerolatus]|uniref:Neutral zinc metallopeptidase n=1 Tax=Diaphorobacter aerolatus TaxID=1288495 RepID=A0A7H0GMY7_9BURK|nr:neutral zinc metallopeptidase [Diaphorobacter aerolatus]QNP49653.1 neutral zinc metallopeptidase [Diaphorobacter aerolatus]
MKWEGNRESSNVEDRRGESGGGGGMIGGRSIGIGTVVVALIGWGVFGINPLTTIGVLSGGGEQQQVQQQGPAKAPPADDQQAKFVQTVLGSTEDVWTAIFKQGGAQYREPKLVLFRGVVPTACGTGQSAMGPFYCPGDQKVYLDMGFFDTMSRQLGAPGEFARAYVIAHEVGHHVQTLLGTTEKVDNMRGRVSQRDQNALSVRLELQADCYAGIWANHSQQAKNWLDQSDIESAINAAQSIGDDKLQREHTGGVRPDAFTHGSSAQRVRWFTTGLKTGSVQSCDTFNTQSL